MRQLVFTPSNEAQGRWHLQPPGEALINGYTPYEALLHTLCLILLYTIVLAMILFIFNTCLNKAAGSALAGAVHIVGYMMAFDSFGFDYGRFSLFFNGMFLFVIDTGISLLSSYVLLLLILCILLFIGPGFMRRADFKYSVGGKND